MVLDQAKNDNRTELQKIIEKSIVGHNLELTQSHSFSKYHGGVQDVLRYMESRDGIHRKDTRLLNLCEHLPSFDNGKFVADLRRNGRDDIYTPLDKRCSLDVNVWEYIKLDRLSKGNVTTPTIDSSLANFIIATAMSNRCTQLHVAENLDSYLEAGRIHGHL